MAHLVLNPFLVGRGGAQGDVSQLHPPVFQRCAAEISVKKALHLSSTFDLFLTLL
jgi:hypothetical protein